MRMRWVKNRIKSIPGVEAGYFHFMNNVIGRYPKENLAMFHEGRCGSTVLARLLNGHSAIYWGNELFETYANGSASPMSAEFTRDVILQSRKLAISPVFGFETKYLRDSHLGKDCINLNYKDYLDLLRLLGFNRFVILHRRNYLKRAISVQIGQLSREWHRESSAALSLKKIELSVDRFKTGEFTERNLLDYFKTIDDDYESLKQALHKDLVLNLTYEDDILLNPSIAYRKICDFMPIPFQEQKVTLKRTNPFPLASVLTNYEEIFDLLQHTKYAWMLHEIDVDK